MGSMGMTEDMAWEKEDWVADTVAKFRTHAQVQLQEQEDLLHRLLQDRQKGWQKSFLAEAGDRPDLQAHRPPVAKHVVPLPPPEPRVLPSHEPKPAARVLAVDGCDMIFFEAGSQDVPQKRALASRERSVSSTPQTRSPSIQNGQHLPVLHPGNVSADVWGTGAVSPPHTRSMASWDNDVLLTRGHGVTQRTSSAEADQPRKHQQLMNGGMLVSPAESTGMLGQAVSASNKQTSWRRHATDSDSSVGAGFPRSREGSELNQLAKDDRSLATKKHASRKEKQWLQKKVFKDERNQEDAKRHKRKEQIEKFFDGCMGLVIMVNTAVIFAQLEWAGVQLDAAAAQGNRGGDTLDQVFLVLEHVFIWIYVVELVVRLRTFRCEFFRDWTNMLDLFVVLISFLDMYVLKWLNEAGGQEQNVNLGVVRVLRLARLTKAMRFVRVLKLFPSLRMLVQTIAVSVGSLFWSMLILSIFGIVSAMILCQTVQEFIQDSSIKQETRLWMDQHYGTASKATWSVFELTMSGCWPNYAQVLIREVTPLYSVFFAFYVSVVVFAVIRIITALFLKDTLQVAANDTEAICAAKTKQKEQFLIKLNALFENSKGYDRGKMSRQEFTDMMEKETVQIYLSALDIETYDLEGLWSILSDDCSESDVPFKVLHEELWRLKGTAKSSDVVRLSLDINKLLERCDRLLMEALRMPHYPPVWSMMDPMDPSVSFSQTEEHRQVDMATHDERSSESKDDGFSTAPVDASNRASVATHESTVTSWQVIPV